MNKLTRDGTAEPVSRDQFLWRERGQGNVRFPCLADHEQDWQPYPARIQELELLDAAVAAVSSRDDGASAGGLRHQAEALPRHMRRRTTSHNPRRMPVALKNANATARATARKGSRAKRSPGYHQSGAEVGVELPSAGAAAEGEVRCRKHRRRPRAMLAARSPHADGLPGEAGAGSPARWLETHIWHAKRMHMGEMWGFKVPITSNRGRRAAVEAALDHCTLQDVTFLRPIEISAPLGCLLGLLSAVTDPLDDRPKHPDCVKGFVEAQTYLYRVNEFPLGCIAPITIMWSPPDPVVENQGVDGARESDKEEDCDDFRRAWLWVHPAAAKEAFQQIMQACALEGAPWAGAVEAGPVAGGLNRLRVRGSRAHAVVQRVLRTPAFDGPVAASPLTPRGPSKAVGFEEVARENAEHWRALCSPSSVAGNSGQSASLRPPPPGSVLSITVLDPRERVVVPPSRAKFALSQPVTAGEKSDSATGSKVTAAWREWWPRWAAVSPLWDPDARDLSTCLAEVRRDHVLNEDRRREREGGAWDHIGGRDDLSPPPSSSTGRGIAPVMLVASSPSPAELPTRAEGQGREGEVSRAGGVDGEEGGGEGRDAGKKRRRGATAIEAGWDLILPAGWASVFFCELVMAGARAISLEDADGLALEAGKPSFPADFPDTASGRRHWDEIGHESRAVWTRTRPKHRGFVKPQVPHGGTLQARTDPTPSSRKQTQARTESGAEAEAEPRDALRAFRPDFCLLASGAAAAAAGGGGNDGDDLSHAAGSVESGINRSSASLASIQPPTSDTTPSASAGGQERKEGAGEGDNDAAQSPSLSVAVGESKRAAREFEKGPEAFATARGFHYVQAFLPGEGTAVGGDGEEAFLPPPLQLAFPTVLEVLLRQRKGVPKAGALIRPASSHHHDLWLEGERAGAQPWPGFGATAPPPPVEGIPHRASARLLGGSLEQVGPAMGAVTSGGFSFLRGCAVGRGVCEAVALRDAMFTSLVHGHRCRQELGTFGRASSPAHGWALVLVGNEAGSWFRPAVVEVVA